jgi:hypothetical protein
MHTTYRVAAVFLSVAISQSTFAFQREKKSEKPAAIRPADADADFAFQGEYAGTFPTNDGELKYGVQVIALGNGKFEAVGYRGGLPGAGWDQQAQPTRTAGSRKDDAVVFETENERSIVKSNRIRVERTGGEEIGTLERVERKSTTLGQKPPEGAIVLFDGKSTDNFTDGKMTDDGLLIEGATTKRNFQDFTLHFEFLLSYMPEARGQDRSNSGCYLQGRYEVQILDSFGLAGKDNECGGIYGVGAPLVNMCLPPLAWQTYDIDYTAARFDDTGRKTADARITVKHNGVLIQDNVAVRRTTRGASHREGPEPGPLHFQNHYNPLRFRNIWIVEKS